MAARPSTARKTTPKTEAKRKQEIDGEAIAIRINGEVYTVNRQDISGLTDVQFRRHTGISVTGLIRQLYDDPSLDTFAGFIVLAKLLRGDTPNFEEELKKIGIGVEVDHDVKPDDSPEA